MGDVDTFHRFAHLYDLAMPGADAERIGRALAVADRDLDRVVDVAGGSGRGLRAIDDIRAIDGDRFSVDGFVLDAAGGMVRRARRRGHAAVQSDATRLPLVDDAVDAVVILDAFHHLPDRDAVFAESARVLAPGGVLVVQEFDPTTIRGRAVAAVEHLVGFDSTFEPASALEGRMRAAGLSPTVIDGGFSYVVAGCAA